MDIGLIMGLHGGEDRPPALSWANILQRARAAESVGFDSIVFEDALLYRGIDSSDGCWESMAIAAGLAAATSTIELGQSVVNAPYRSPALVAKMADTIDEISGGRYILGLGAGNTADSDYDAFGFAKDNRFSRFAEAIAIIHPLLKTGRVDYDGTYYSARDAELVLRGPRPSGPPIVIAARGPKMLTLTAKFADGWNWWTLDAHAATDDLQRLTQAVEAACEEVSRDPATLRRSVDVYSIDVLGVGATDNADDTNGTVRGSSEEIADTLLSLGRLGFDRVHCDLVSNGTPESMLESVEAMEAVVDLLHTR